MGSSSRARGRRAGIAGGTLLATAAGILLINNGTESSEPPQPPAAQGFPDRTPAGHRPLPAGAPALPAAEPVRVRVPALRIDAPLTRLGLAADGSLAAPPDKDKNLAGWYGDGTSPGTIGTALIAGHVDNHAGPAVFYHLGALKKGNTVQVLRKDGRTAIFTVDAIEVYDGRNFPDDKVYGEAPRPELRLITCGGGFNRAKREYRGNVVVFAHLTGSVREVRR